MIRNSGSSPLSCPVFLREKTIDSIIVLLSILLSIIVLFQKKNEDSSGNFYTRYVQRPSHSHFLKRSGTSLYDEPRWLRLTLNPIAVVCSRVLTRCLVSSMQYLCMLRIRAHVSFNSLFYFIFCVHGLPVLSICFVDTFIIYLTGWIVSKLWQFLPFFG